MTEPLAWVCCFVRQSQRMARARLLTRDERHEAGKALRDRCPRASHGKLVLGQGAKRDVVSLIAASNRGRLENLIPVRHGRMLQSPFAFFRGTAAIQAHDLAGTPTSGIQVQACGDCHLMNFGGFATPERNLNFDINDFDETLPAPFEWDVKRLAASFVVAARWRGFRRDEPREIAVEAVASYREAMGKAADKTVLEGWYSRITLEETSAIAGGGHEVRRRVAKRIAEAHKRTHEHVLQKLTSTSGGRVRIVDQPPLLYHPDERDVNQRTIAAFLRRYRDTLAPERRMLFDRFQTADVVMKVAGVGSVGTRCYVVLLLAAPDDPMFLQVKEARRSVLEPYLRRRPVSHNGERVVIGQRLMQSASDIFLGWSRGARGREFYVRQLRDMKIAPEVETQTPNVMRTHARLCGLALARAHDKAGDAAKISGYLGGSSRFDEAVGAYAVAYADQVERDYAAFAAGVRRGRLTSDVSPSRLEAMLR
jgi:uncharacterized protein (DUF2252 family)